jgi:hypothetical protein
MSAYAQHLLELVVLNFPTGFLMGLTGIGGAAIMTPLLHYREAWRGPSFSITDWRRFRRMELFGADDRTLTVPDAWCPHLPRARDTESALRWRTVRRKLRH